MALEQSQNSKSLEEQNNSVVDLLEKPYDLGNGEDYDSNLD